MISFKKSVVDYLIIVENLTVTIVLNMGRYVIRVKLYITYEKITCVFKQLWCVVGRDVSFVLMGSL